MKRICIALASVAIALPAYAQTTAPPAAKSESGSQVQASAAAKRFVEQAAIGDMYEIQSSRLVLDKVQVREFQDFARTIIDDHTKSSDQLKSMTQSVNGLQPPTQLDDKHRKMIDQLQSASGADLARQYKTQQVQAHQDAVKLFQDFANQGDDARLKQFAEQTLPKLKEHLRMAQGLTDNPQVAQGMTRDEGARDRGQTQGDAQTRQAIISQPAPNHMLGSKLRGTTVYGANDANVGEINDIILTTDGRIAAVVVGVGGFLGIGEKDVAIPFSQINIRELERTTTGMAAQERQGRSAGPQRIYLRDMTRQDLEQAPTFRTEAGTGNR
ncbi:MAG: DUF4142 domain-containing protein [Bradyrhizobium sp.]|uniref:DUF4142 domain-containing protein n=1 Tax=Bradyrhizobium sp. TaxID=376 RepID=UPI0025BD457A|nr:DUF4142 domain-containing protein [Bradyrhizobium sp.]MBI5263537.1 DUF4142 domain-containing protein [Bradyrhizobium sp.]